MLEIIVTIKYKGSTKTFMIPSDYIKNESKVWGVFLSSSDCAYMFSLMAERTENGELTKKIVRCEATSLQDGDFTQEELDYDNISIDFIYLEEANELSLINDLNNELVEKMISSLIKLNYKLKDEIQLHYNNDFLIIRLNMYEKSVNYTIETFTNKVWKDIITDNEINTLKRIVTISNFISKLEESKNRKVK